MSKTIVSTTGKSVPGTPLVGIAATASRGYKTPPQTITGVIETLQQTGAGTIDP